MPRVAYITCDTPAWYEIAAKMQHEEDWQPIYWIADAPATPMIRERFPGVIVHNRFEAYHLNAPSELGDLWIAPLDEPFLNDMAEAQIIALKMADVVDSVDAFGFNDRRRFFRKRLQFWRAIITAIRPDVAVFGFSAHVLYDYAIYTLCRYYGIRTVMFEATFNFALLFPMEDPLIGSTDIEQTVNELVAADQGGEVELPPLYEEYLTRLRGKYTDALPWYMKLQFDSFPKELSSTVYTGSADAVDQAAGPLGPQTERGETATGLMTRLLSGIRSRRKR